MPRMKLVLGAFFFYHRSTSACGNGCALKLIFLTCFIAIISSSSLQAQSEVDSIHSIPSNPVWLEDSTSSSERLSIKNSKGETLKTSVVRSIQFGIDSYLKQANDPIGAVVLADIKTGDILAIAQGRNPASWQAGVVHSALYPRFPAASLFKTVVAAAVFDLTSVEPNDQFNLQGGCADVQANGVWLRDFVEGRSGRMSVADAYGRSCNGFFAQLMLNRVGLSAMGHYTRFFGWESPDARIGLDFAVPASAFQAPEAATASAQTVGRFGAGFGHVGLSAVHAAWMMRIIAGDGRARPMKFFEIPSLDSPLLTSRGPIKQHMLLSGSQDENKVDSNPTSPLQSLDSSTLQKLRDVMTHSVRGRGTASYAFRKGRYKQLKNEVAGKTGTLSSQHLSGITTWFAGFYPYDNPEVVVAAVVLLEHGVWHIKGPNLAAEAIKQYQMWKSKDSKLGQPSISSTH